MIAAGTAARGGASASRTAADGAAEEAWMFFKGAAAEMFTGREAYYYCSSEN
jgi:hypothetical protein